jgi:hypothetical protein
MKKIVSKILCVFLVIFLSVSVFGQNDHLIGYWPLNGDANDLSGNENNGTVNGAIPTIDRFGNANGAYDFNGFNSFISIDYKSGDKVEKQYSVTMWVNEADSQANWAKLVCVPQRIDTPWREPYHYMCVESYVKTNDSLNFEFAYFSNTGFEGNVFKNPCLKSNKWEFVTLIFDSGKVVMYVNAKEVYRQLVPFTAMYFPKLPISIGSRSSDSLTNGEFFKGKIDDIRFYNKPLSEFEVSVLYNEVTKIIIEDTLTIHKFDTIKVPIQVKFSVFDTIPVFDTSFVQIKTFVYDTIKVAVPFNVSVFDTIPVFDSIQVSDTLLITNALFTNVPTEENTYIKIYPNPTKDYIYVNALENESDNTLKILDSNGKTLVNRHINKEITKLNMKEFGKKGLYVVQLINNDTEEVFTKKIILQ